MKRENKLAPTNIVVVNMKILSKHNTLYKLSFCFYQLIFRTKILELMKTKAVDLKMKSEVCVSNDCVDVWHVPD